jgi:hypothetical protein
MRTSGKAADIEEFWSLVTREKGDNFKNRRVLFPAIFLLTSGVVRYFEQLGVLYMFYWLSYTKHMFINKVTMNIMINLKFGFEVVVHI